MALPLLEQQLDHVEVDPGGFGQHDTAGSGGARRRFSDSEPNLVANRHDLRDGGVAIHHCDGFAPPDGSEVFTEPRLEFRNTDLPHSHIMTRNGHIDKLQ